MASRLVRFLHYIWGDYLTKVWLFVLAFIGFMQTIFPLLFGTPEGDMNILQQALAFFVTRWSWEWWAIVPLATFVIVLLRSLWNLGGFDLRIGLHLQSEPLTDGQRRFLGLRVTNLSPREIQQVFVRLDGLRKISGNKWKPSSLINRRDKFWWTSWDPPRQGTKNLPPGYDIVADMLVMQVRLDVAVFLLQAQTLYMSIPPGKYRVDASVVGTYTNRRFEIPFSFEFVYSGQMELSKVRPVVKQKNLDWRIEKPIDVSVLPTPDPKDMQQLMQFSHEMEKGKDEINERSG